MSIDHGASWKEHGSLIPADDSIAIRASAIKFDALGAESTLVVAYCGFANRHLPGGEQMEVWVLRARGGTTLTRRFLGRFTAGPDMQDIRLLQNRDELLLVCTANGLEYSKTIGADGSPTTTVRETGGLMLFRSRDGGIVWSGPQNLDPPAGYADWSNICEVRSLSIKGRSLAVFNSIGRLHAVALTDSGWGVPRWIRGLALATSDYTSPGSFGGVPHDGGLLLSWITELSQSAGPGQLLGDAEPPRQLRLARAVPRGDSLDLAPIPITGIPGMSPISIRIVSCDQGALILCTGKYENKVPGHPVPWTGMAFVSSQ